MDKPKRDLKREFLLSMSDDHRLWGFAVMALFCGAFLLFDAWTTKSWRVTLLALVFLVAGSLAFKLFRWRARHDKEEAAKPVVHEVEVTRSLPDFWAKCSCGWWGEDRKTVEEALQDAQQHSGTRPAKVTIIDDDEDDSDEIYQVDASEAEPVGIHEVNVYWDHSVYAPSCSCGWQGAETAVMSDALAETRAHGKVEDVEITDVGRRVEEEP